VAKPVSDPQKTIFDTDWLCPGVLDPETDHLIFVIRDEIAPLISDEDFADMYQQRGRRPISPKVLVLTMLLQFLENLPDRQAARNVRLRLDWKIAMGLSLDYEGFHFSVLEKFRDRLIENRKQRELFDRLIDKLVELGLIRPRGKQRIDSTWVAGHLRKLTKLELMTESIRAAMMQIKKELGKEVLEEAVPEEIISNYERVINSWKMDNNELKERYIQAGKDAMLVLERLRAHKKREEFFKLEKVRILEKVFEQNFEIKQNGKPEPEDKVERKEKIVTPHEPEARYSERKGKSWIGYKLQVTETAEESEQGEEVVNFITDVEVTNAAEHDSQYTIRAIERQKEKGLEPEEMLTDSAYVNSGTIAEARKMDTELTGPVSTGGGKRTEVPIEDFEIDYERKQAICPKGVRSKSWSKNKKGAIMITFPKNECQRCDMYGKCTKSKRGRVLYLVAGHEIVKERKREMKKESYKRKMRLRRPVEGTISELVRAHGMRQARYRGRERIRLQAIFSALAVNVKRYAKKLKRAIFPRAETAVCAV